jgi:spore coat-associated protein N
MKKKMLLSLLLIGLVCALIAGGTFAYFSSVVTNTGNIFTAGTLNIATGSTASTLFSAASVVPSGTSTVPDWSSPATVTLNKNGSNVTPTNFYLKLSSLTDTTATLSDGTTQSTPLSGALLILVKDSSGNTVYSGPLFGLWTPRTLTWFSGSTTSITYTVQYGLPDTGAPASNTTGDNQYQGSSVTAGFAFTATQ